MKLHFVRRDRYFVASCSSNNNDNRQSLFIRVQVTYPLSVTITSSINFVKRATTSRGSKKRDIFYRHSHWKFSRARFHEFFVNSIASHSYTRSCSLSIYVFLRNIWLFLVTYDREVSVTSNLSHFLKRFWDFKD